MSGRDVQIRIGYGDVLVLVNTEGGYQPDVIDDLCTRAVAMFREVWAEVRDDYESDDETADTEGTATDG